MVVVSDTSALSALAETGLLELLPILAGRVTVPEAVMRECLDAGAPSELRAWMSHPPDWLILVPDPPALLEETLPLGIGEASAITLAWSCKPDCKIIIDEKRGRKVARALGLGMMGALALLTEAALRGLVDFDDALQRLKAADFRISDRLITEARQRLAAAWPDKRR